MTLRVAFYARVSSEQQVQTGTIESQIMALQERIKADGHHLLKEDQFIDDGYSGSTLARPELERLRDTTANCLLDRLYVHSPDRLARKYAYQYLLLEEFNRLGIEVIFLNNQLGNNPESDLLLQVQGIISEYERTKIMERSRRGKLHAARQGSSSVLSNAPYGYRYTPKQNGSVGYDIYGEEAEVIRLLFSWVGYERMSINAATHRLTERGFNTPTGKNTRWNRGSVHRMLRNPAYKGKAAFGKTKCIPKKPPRLRPYKGQSLHSKQPCSIEHTPKERWTFIPVPSIIDENLFEIVQEQLEENKRLKRERATGALYLLQGLVVCNLCQYGYFGNTATGARKHSYYSCGGTRTYANRDRACSNASIQAKRIEDLVWEEVKYLLKAPFYLEKEYTRRVKELEKGSSGQDTNYFKDEKARLEKSIARLIDSYMEELIEKSEFEPRIKNLKARFVYIEQQLLRLMDNQTHHSDLQLIIGRIEEFSAKVRQNLEDIDWQTKREIVTALIKQIEIGRNEVNIVFKVDPYPTLGKRQLLEDCRKSGNTCVSNFHF